MFKKIISVIILPAFLFSCSGGQGPNDNKGETVAETDSTSPAGCFAHYENRDTVVLHIAKKGKGISGTLLYNLFEKDRNNGTIDGEMKGDTLFARYTFQAEGTTSEREIVFLKVDGNLLEGYGDMEEQNGRMVFKKQNPLSFNNKMILKPIPCE